MDKIKRDLEEKILDFNARARESYASVLDLDESGLRDFIEENIGGIGRAKKLDPQSLASYEGLGGIVGVDGSVNRKGGASPHYIEFFRALAKSTRKSLEPVLATEVYSPILDPEGLEGEVKDRRDEILTRLEVQVAIGAAEKLDPHLIMMDGSFIRYIINCKSLWEELRTICESKGILLIGVIEDIKTNIIGTRLVEEGLMRNPAYDRELLFGRLGLGEFILIRYGVSQKSRAGELSSAFMRTSLSPNIIGIDIIDTQRKYLGEMASLVYSLTPENSRGVPIWLDIVDREVKISSRMMEMYLENYLDRDIYERFFVEARSKRV